ncbi:hypothetical protein N6L26_06420 [Qipengyuania sp. SS22]|uniref:hypothetical protein n=1 Tax=Qipengyuania sp. SS22 TaxID=2979461 RepID=UPI0021E6037C|nr:hypothetical protein [Qipengyuania sp. SS22]UYH56186.1 hypothetical protein N6L26_06420 [Qipengyuania sp. SS22]
MLRAVEVFTPNNFPVYTYVERGDNNLEDAFRRALSTPNTVLSVSGPSKSGKTVLAERVIGKENIIYVSGAELGGASDLWGAALDALNQPNTITDENSVAKSRSESHEASINSEIVPGTGVGAKKVAKRETQIKSGITNSFGRSGLSQVAKLIGGSDTVIFIDDFHYMTRPVQTEVARQIRAGSGQGIKFCTASVPHRSDDVVRSNHELRGRTTHIDTNFWDVNDLSQIGVQGFPLLYMAIDESEIQLLAVEACGSPQLMQQICLQTCIYFGVEEKLPKVGNFKVEKKSLSVILNEASNTTDYRSLLTNMHIGPRIRGTPRASHTLLDGTKGDVYRAVLLALATGEPITDIPYANLVERTQAVCSTTSPTGQSIASAAEQMAKAAREMYPDQRIIEWDSGAGGGTLTIVDPYLLFYLRNSDGLRKLGQA